MILPVSNFDDFVQLHTVKGLLLKTIVSVYIGKTLYCLFNALFVKMYLFQI